MGKENFPGSFSEDREQEDVRLMDDLMDMLPSDTETAEYHETESKLREYFGNQKFMYKTKTGMQFGTFSDMVAMCTGVEDIVGLGFELAVSSLSIHEISDEEYERLQNTPEETLSDNEEQIADTNENDEDSSMRSDTNTQSKDGADTSNTNEATGRGVRFRGHSDREVTEPTSLLDYDAPILPHSDAADISSNARTEQQVARGNHKASLKGDGETADIPDFSISRMASLEENEERAVVLEFKVSIAAEVSTSSELLPSKEGTLTILAPATKAIYESEVPSSDISPEGIHHVNVADDLDTQSTLDMSHGPVSSHFEEIEGSHELLQSFVGEENLAVQEPLLDPEIAIEHTSSFAESDDSKTEFKTDRPVSLQTILENEADVHTPEEMIEMAIEITGGFIEAEAEFESGASPIEVLQLSKRVRQSILSLEKAATQEDCLERVEELRGNLAELLSALGFDNSDELALRLVRQYDTKTLKQFIAALLKTVTAGEIAQHGLQRQILPIKHHWFGKRVVERVVYAVTGMQVQAA